MSENLAVEVLRGEAIESRHEVGAAVVDADGRLVFAAGDVDAAVFLRSSAKPLQAVAAVAAGAFARLGASEEELAVAAASHSGEQRHVAEVARLLARLGLDAGALRCGTHPPFEAAVASAAAATPLGHNCSGKHAAFLALAAALGVPPGSYLEGAVQERVLATVAELCGLRTAEVLVATDGCSAPTFAVPLRAAALAFARLARPAAAPAALRDALRRVAGAMVRHPALVAGTGRFDTILMTEVPGLLSKAGAEAVQAVAEPKRGLGLVVKIADGGSRAVAPATLAILERQQVLPVPLPRSLGELMAPAVTAHAGTVVGRIRASFR